MLTENIFDRYEYITLVAESFTSSVLLTKCICLMLCWWGIVSRVAVKWTGATYSAVIHLPWMTHIGCRSYVNSSSRWTFLRAVDVASAVIVA